METIFVNEISLWLIIRAVLFAILFLMAGLAAVKTNSQQKVSVTIIAAICFLLFIINMWMAYEWITLFYF